MLSNCTLALVLCGCGGGAGGEMSFIPSPPATPTPSAPTPPPANPSPPPLPAGPIGVQSSAPFATAAYDFRDQKVVSGGNAVQFAYSAATDRYTITVPEFETGELRGTNGFGGSFDPGTNSWLNLFSTISDVVPGSGSSTQLSVSLDWPASSPYKYTSVGRWHFVGASYPALGVFAYGIPTAPGDVPVAGTASYSGGIQGTLDDKITGVGGSVTLNFDFAAGTLSGVMKPIIAPVWDEVSLGDYTFRDTVFSKGSTTFSGAFQIDGTTAPSSFEGRFTGPTAAELLANWTAPYRYPGTATWGTMGGVWIAKKP
jgi:hypothetical protein